MSKAEVSYGNWQKLASLATCPVPRWSILKLRHSCQFLDTARSILVVRKQRPRGRFPPFRLSESMARASGSNTVQKGTPFLLFNSEGNSEKTRANAGGA